MVLIKILSIFGIFLNLAFAQTDMAKHGQKDFENYFGPESPKFNYDSYLDSMVFVDDQIVNDYSADKISLEVEDLANFFKREFYQGLNCPDQAYAPKYHYLQYLSRLQVISYLFQSLREHAYMSVRFNLKTNCNFNWTEVIKSCRPTTSEMKGFTRDATIALQSLKDIVVPFEESKPKKLEEWMNNFHQKKFQTLTHYRLADSCGDKCSKLDSDLLNKKITQICSEEKNLLVEICSERDALYGVSNVSELYHLITHSSGIKGIDDDGHAAGCLARFIEQNKNNEKKVYFLKDIFSVLFEYNMSHSPLTAQGRLFTIGAVKEYTDKGLASIFTVKEKKKEATADPKEEKVVQLTNPEFEEIILPPIEKKKRKKKVVEKVVVKKEKPVKKMSSFFVASEFRKNFDLPEVEINMSKFKYDYIFTLSQINQLEEKVKEFSTVKSLNAMKKFDQLGTKKSPVPLKFIKFLIDNKHHQNLFNMINILGDKFYIFNDIDKEARKLDLISLQNDISTNFQWKLKILKN